MNNTLTERQTNRRTGYPSLDKPWLKYYKENAEQGAHAIPKSKTVWDVVEERLNRFIAIPAIEYFGRSISRHKFIDNVYIWARAFKALGIGEDEIVAYYGPFLPEACYMIFALNIIGACPYFLKLAISPEALAEETKECKVAIVFDQMWENVRGEFSKNRFEKVIILHLTDSMPALKKQILSVLLGIKGKAGNYKSKKYLSATEAKKLFTEYSGEVRTPYVSDRNAFITSSSGTTVGGVVKGVVATNETIISQLYMSEASGCQYFPGERCLNHFPPTAATSLNILFILPLFRGMTVVIDPRVSEKDFFNQVTKSHASVICSTGSAWNAFFNRLDKEGKIDKYDFSFAKAWVVGGEGTDKKKFQKWQKIMAQAKSDRGIASAYGCSEVFASVCSEFVNARYDFSKPIMSVGIPFAGIVVGVFNDSGDELGYNQRGELRIKSNSIMKGYYNKPELTDKTKINGWIHTGDMAEIDENGFVYIWGRVSDAISLPEGHKIYLFDITNKIKEFDYISDAVVLKKPFATDSLNLVAHIVWSETVKEEDKQNHLIELTQRIKQYEPAINLCIYAFHEIALPYSPTTLKIDKNIMSKQDDGYVKVVGSAVTAFSFCGE